MNNQFNSDYNITIIKIIAIIYIAVLYSIFGLFITYNLDSYIFDSKNIKIKDSDLDKISLFTIVIETAFIVGIISVAAYIGRNLIEQIPFPLNGYYKFDYLKVKDVSSGAILTIFLYAFSDTLIKKYHQIRYKLDNK